MHGGEPTPAPVVSREVYAVYLIAPSGRRKVRTRRLHRALKDALAEAAEQAAAYPDWGVEIVHELHTITELNRLLVPTAQSPSARSRRRAGERANGNGDGHAPPVPRRRIAPLFDESA